MKLMSLSIISSKDGLINVEDGVGSLPTGPVQARLASPESLGSLASSSEQAQLATPESLSPLFYPSGQSQLASGESLNDLPSTSQQALHGYGTRFHTDDCIIPIKIHNHAETQDDEDSEDSLSSDESHGHGPSRRPMLPHDQRCVQEASWDLVHIRSLHDDINVESSCLGLEEQRKGNTDSIWSLNDEEFMACDQEDSSSESDDSCPPSPGCSFNEGFSFQLFNPDSMPKVDRWSRFLFPLSFGLFNVVYWLYHIY
jgi:gamma-aminobutyric acid receptor subunit theta